MGFEGLLAVLVLHQLNGADEASAQLSSAWRS